MVAQVQIRGFSGGRTGSRVASHTCRFVGMVVELLRFVSCWSPVILGICRSRPDELDTGAQYDNVPLFKLDCIILAWHYFDSLSITQDGSAIETAEIFNPGLPLDRDQLRMVPAYLVRRDQHIRAFVSSDDNLGTPR
jgi:hypothetical protein